MNEKAPLSYNLNTENQSIPLYQQVIDLIKSDISSGFLSPGAFLPSSREMAKQLGVSRKTIVKAIDLLLFDGTLTSKDRVGVLVASKNKESRKIAEQKNNFSEPSPHTNPRIVVNDGLPDTSLIPFREFSRTYRQKFNRMAQWQMLGYNDTMGYYKFREIIAEGLNESRGLSAKANNICIVRGSQMALFLAANAVLSSGDHIAIEMPGYQNAYKTFDTAKLCVHSIAIDKDGIDVDQIENLCKEVKLKAVYITPRHQYPTTVTLSMSRRQKLRDLVKKYDFLIIEDDFGCEYNFSSRQLLPLSAMIDPSHYLYIGTYSKIFAPGIRVGYIASSEANIAKIADYRALIDMQGDTIMERALHDLYESGNLQRHLRRSSKIYKERLKWASSEIQHILGNSVNYKQTHGGLAIWIGLPKCPHTESSLREHFLHHGISIPIFTLADGSIGVRIGYASLKQEHLTEVLSCLKSAITNQ